VFDVVRLVDSMAAAQIAPLRPLFDVAVFHQRGSLFRCTRSKIQTHQWFGSYDLGPCHEFIRPELVGIDCVPGFVEDPRAILLWANAIEPVVARNEVAARIPDDGNAEPLYLLNHIFAEASAVREARCRIVNTLIDGASQMLKKGAEEVAIKRSDHTPGIYENACDTAGGGGWLSERERVQQGVGRACNPGGSGLLQKTAAIIGNHFSLLLRRRKSD